MVNICVLKADITTISADIIVNAANPRLLGGGGVDGAIHRIGGPQIMIECDRIREQRGGCPTGQAVITSAGNLPARFVIHSVGPIWNGGENSENKLLRQCYLSCLQLADGHSGEFNRPLSLSFPNISTGIYGFPKPQAAVIALDTVNTYLESMDSVISQVNFVCFDDENYAIYERLLNKG